LSNWCTSPADMEKRIVFDTGVLVSAAILPRSTPAHALRKALLNYELCASVATLDELAKVLKRTKFDRYISPTLRQAFVDGLQQHWRMVGVTLRVNDCADPGDNMFLELAETACAELIISSDPHLTILHPWRGIPIIPPAAFLAISE